MNWKLFERTLLLLVVTFIIVLVLFVMFFFLVFVPPGTSREPFAPELYKSYVLTEDLVRTSIDVPLPGWFQPRQNVPFVMTHEEYLFMKELIDPDPLPKLGMVEEGNLVQVEQVFTFNSFEGDYRYGKLQFINPATEEKRTAYSYLDDVGPKLTEVQ